MIIFFSLSSLPLYSQTTHKLINITNNPDKFAFRPAIAIDSKNNVHIAWYAFYEYPGAPDGVASNIFYSNNVKGKFCRSVEIKVPEGEDTGWYSKNPSISVDSQGNAYIIFVRWKHQVSLSSEDDIYYVTNAPIKNSNGIVINPGNRFKKPIRLVAGVGLRKKPEDVSGPNQPFIHCDSKDHVHITFQAWGFGDIWECILYMNNSKGKWSKPSLAVSKFNIFLYKSCIDDKDKVHIVFEGYKSGYSNLIYYTKKRKKKFKKPTRVSSPLHEQCGDADLAVDSRGKVHVVYRALFPFEYDGIYYANNVKKKFKPWNKITESWSYNTSIKVDDTDTVHVAYEKSDTLYFGDNSSGKFKFIFYDKMPPNFTLADSYFALGDLTTYNFTFHAWLGKKSNYTGAEIYYLRSICYLSKRKY